MTRLIRRFFAGLVAFVRPTRTAHAMSRGVAAGIAELHYIATIADPAAPTIIELNAGVDLTGQLADGSPTTPFDGSIVDSADMSSRFNQTVPGTFGGPPVVVEFVKELEQANDTAYSTCPRDTSGYWAIVRRPLATKGTFAAGDYVDIWPMTVVTRNPAPLQRNEVQKYTVECAVPGVPGEDILLA